MGILAADLAQGCRDLRGSVPGAGEDLSALVIVYAENRARDG